MVIHAHKISRVVPGLSRACSKRSCIGPHGTVSRLPAYLGTGTRLQRFRRGNAGNLRQSGSVLQDGRLSFRHATSFYATLVRSYVIGSVCV